MSISWPPSLMKDAELEAYVYFDRNIRELPKKPDGTIDTMQPGFRNNDVDAYRHAYVSGIFTHEYGEKIAAILGWLNEFASPSSVQDRDMDLWNNDAGRKLALKNKARDELAKAIKEALDNGKLITSLSDNRHYQGAEVPRPQGEHSVIVLDENDNGANELFFDMASSTGMKRSAFVQEIKSGRYPGYAVRNINGIAYPVSKRNSSATDNLG